MQQKQWKNFLRQARERQMKEKISRSDTLHYLAEKSEQGRGISIA